MNATSSLVLTGGIVTLGQWVEGRPLSVRVVVGVTFAAIALSVLGNFDADVANKMALLILVAAVFRYGVPIVQKAGLAR
jgi:uncharacterized membrane protein YjjB (DUF3815 family)